MSKAENLSQPFIERLRNATDLNAECTEHSTVLDSLLRIQQRAHQMIPNDLLEKLKRESEEDLVLRWDVMRVKILVGLVDSALFGGPKLNILLCETAKRFETSKDISDVCNFALERTSIMSENGPVYIERLSSVIETTCEEYKKLESFVKRIQVGTETM
jgi:hypothetical protein